MADVIVVLKTDSSKNKMGGYKTLFFVYDGRPHLIVSVVCYDDFDLHQAVINSQVF